MGVVLIPCTMGVVTATEQKKRAQGKGEVNPRMSVGLRVDIERTSQPLIFVFFLLFCCLAYCCDSGASDGWTMSVVLALFWDRLCSWGSTRIPAQANAPAFA